MESGKTGLSEFNGIITEDFYRELRGQEGYKRYDEMRLNSPVVGGLLLAVEQSIRRVRWQFVSNAGENDPRLVLLNDALAAMSHSMNDHVTEALTMLPFGFSLFEIVYQRVGGALLWRKFAIRGQNTIYRWLLDDNGGLAGVVQQSQANYRPITIPIERLILYRTRVEKGNPEGRSILRTAWTSYYYCKHIQQIEATGIERDLAGLPWIKLPPGADTSGSEDGDTDYGLAMQLVRRIRNDEQAGIVTPAEWDFSLVSTGGARQFNTNEIIQRYESRILMSALAQFLILGQNSIGTQALSRDQSNFFTMSVNATADNIAETFSKYAIPRLLRLNGYDPTGVRLEHSPAGDPDLPGLADVFQKIGDKITWLPTDEVWLRQLLNLPGATPDQITSAAEQAGRRGASGLRAEYSAVLADLERMINAGA